MLSYHFRIEEDAGEHVTVGVFAGRRPGSRGKCGTLTMRHEEWNELHEILVEGGRARATIVDVTRLVEREHGGYANELLPPLLRVPNRHDDSAADEERHEDDRRRDAEEAAASREPE